MEFARRLGIVETRAARIIDQFPAKKQQMEALVENSFLSTAVRGKPISGFTEKIRRIL